MLVLKLGTAFGQPALPDVAVLERDNIVLLSWRCQYSSVKSIAVERSRDSLRDYSVIGYVKNTKKGVQAFADGHPLPGKSYYKLTITFNSGLKWTSNDCSVYVDSVKYMKTNRTLPDNDSLQAFIKTEAKISALNVTPEPLPENGDRNYKADTTALVNIVVLFKEEVPRIKVAGKPIDQKDGISSRVSIIIPEVGVGGVRLTKSPFVSVNSVTGHIDVEVPDNVRKNRYAVRFFDQSGASAVTIPYIKYNHIIVDKRNFQHSGRLKFILTKDGKELESGYIYLDLSVGN